jgi:chromosome partitioning protein
LNNSQINKFLSMHVIVFATHKGGGGKSTLATCLAAAAQDAGESVAIFDLDPKSCATRWGAIRMDPNLPVRMVAAAQLSSALRAAAKRNVTLSIIDTPALESAAALAAVKKADLTIVPTKPSTFDIWSAVVTGRRLNLLRVKFVFLLNQCPPSRRNSRRKQASIAAFQGTGSLLVAKVGMSQRFSEAAAKGKGVAEIAPNGGAARDLRSLWAELKGRHLLTPNCK